MVTNVTALLQKTFAQTELIGRIRQLTRGDRADPLDLVEWLEEQGMNPRPGDATRRDRHARRYRGYFRPPVRGRCGWNFGDELESLREFDPMTQISREQSQITLPPAGELGILKVQVSTAKSGMLATLSIICRRNHLSALGRSD